MLRAALVGALAGGLSGLFGVGGGILMVPALVILLALDQRLASGTSLAAIVPIAAVGVTGYALEGELDLAAAALLAIGAILGAPLGARLIHAIPANRLRTGFALLLVATAVRLFLVVPEPTGREETTFAVAAALVSVGLASGVLAGLFGVGGGIIMVPAQIILLGIAPAVAKGTSLLVIIPTALSGTAQNLRLRNTELRLAGVLAASGLVPAFLGALAATRMPAGLATGLFGVLLLAAASRMVEANSIRLRLRRSSERPQESPRT